MPRPKTNARRLAVQAMYQWSFNQTEAQDLRAQFQEYSLWNKSDTIWFYDLISGTIDQVQNLDQKIVKVIDRRLEQLDPVEHSILRLGLFELLFHPEVPFKVVLNEYINVAKQFGSEKSHAFINASLDKLTKTAREAELLKSD